jgi:subtilisin family serine protease
LSSIMRGAMLNAKSDDFDIVVASRFRMLRHSTHLHRIAALLLIGAAFAGLMQARPSQAQSTQPGIAASPVALEAPVALGERITTAVHLTNLSSAEIVPRILEANVEPPAKAASAPTRVPLPDQAERIDPALLATLKSSPGRQSEFVVYLADQADLSPAYGIADWAERGRFVYQTLFTHAEQTQRGLRSAIAARGLAYEPLWIVNAIAVRGALADAQALAASADVAMVRAYYSASLPPAAAEPATTADRCSPDDPGNPICWGIRAIGADRVWRDFGVTGEGVVVANIDTGVAFRHPALIAQYRGTLDGGFDHRYNWYDPQHLQAEPNDDNGHGTHTIGTMVGAANSASGLPAVGVAPAAKWIAAQGCKYSFCMEKDLILAAQWMIAPTDENGANPRPDLRPMIINNSWSGDGGNQWYSGYTAAWRAAGIFPVFAAGNAGGSRTQICGSVGSPGDYADVVAVGATGRNDGIATFSLLGPSRNGALKPDFTAPGTYISGQQGIWSTFPDGSAGYRALQGTSMAAPHVAGAVALLWSANPSLIGDYDRTYALLRDTALRLPDTRCGDAPGNPNNVYGNGRIDAYAAVTAARVDVPWLIPASNLTLSPNGSASLNVVLAADRVPGPGRYTARLLIYAGAPGSAPQTIEIAMNVAPVPGMVTVTGRVLAADTGAGLAAHVGLRDGLATPTDADGNYSLTLKAGTHEIVATALAYRTGSLMISTAGGARNLTLAPDQPRLAIIADAAPVQLPFAERQPATVVIRNIGTRTLHYQLDVPADRFTMLRSDSTYPDRPVYDWVELPADAAELTLGDTELSVEVPIGFTFPFYNLALTRTLVASDGMLTFDRPFIYSGPSSACLPANEIYFYMIAPFRADLDPTRGGSIRYATLQHDGETLFAVTYEDVRLHHGADDATYTFQALLYRDGRIRFQYKDLAALPANLSVGMQRTPLSVQDVGCGSATPIAEGMAIEFVPQIGPENWIVLREAQGALAPGEERAIPLDLRWVRPVHNPPYIGRVRVVSTDPTAPLKSAPLAIVPEAAPHTFFTPNIGR